MATETMIGVSLQADRLHLRVAWLCGAVLFLEGYDIASVGYAVPSLVDVWKVHPPAFTPVLTAGNVGLLLGSLFAGWLGDRLGRKPRNSLHDRSSSPSIAFTRARPGLRYLQRALSKSSCSGRPGTSFLTERGK